METAKQIRKCLLYIDRNLEESFTLSQIAGEIGYSEFHQNGKNCPDFWTN